MEMVENKIMSSTDCNKTASQFNRLIDSEVNKLRVEFEVFDQTLHCLDEFYFQKVQIQNYKTLTFPLKIIFTLSHGQPVVECVFSINQQVINQNMKSETIIARRFIKDGMIIHGLTPQSICIDCPLSKSVKSAGVKYKCYQEQQKKEKQKNKTTIQQEAISADMLKLKAKCDKMQRAIDLCRKNLLTVQRKLKLEMI